MSATGPNRTSGPWRALHRWRLAVATTAAIALFVAGFAVGGRDSRPSRGDRSARQAQVAQKGRAVMPFDLERTTHVFEDRPDGGVQTVVADDRADRRQVTLIRSHLRKEAARFRRGDFSDPAAIHGQHMPGLAALRRGAPRIDVEYEPRPAGATISYSTGEPALVSAIHAWFAAQRMDHGSHAKRR